jgi:hypothetical protein
MFKPHFNPHIYVIHQQLHYQILTSIQSTSHQLRNNIMFIIKHSSNNHHQKNQHHNHQQHLTPQETIKFQIHTSHKDEHLVTFRHSSI